MNVATCPVESHSIVLLVEDEALVRSATAESLTDAGFEVLEADCAAEALQVIGDRTDIDLMFSDINMPGAVDGLGLAHMVHDSHPRMLLILTSGRAGPAQGDIPGQGRFVEKPYAMAGVTRLISGMIAARQH